MMTKIWKVVRKTVNVSSRANIKLLYLCICSSKFFSSLMWKFASLIEVLTLPLPIHTWIHWWHSTRVESESFGYDAWSLQYTIQCKGDEWSKKMDVDGKRGAGERMVINSPSRWLLINELVNGHVHCVWLYLWWNSHCK